MATRIKWNISTFQKIRRSSEVDNMLQDVVDEMLADLPEGYEGGVSAGRTRSRGSIVTAEYEAILDNEQHQSLLRALADARVGE